MLMRVTIDIKPVVNVPHSNEAERWDGIRADSPVGAPAEGGFGIAA